MKVLKLFFIAGMACLSACGTDKKVDYLDAQNGKALVVNPPLTERHIDKSYRLANVGKVAPPSLTPAISK